MEMVNNAREAHGELFSILHLNHKDFKERCFLHFFVTAGGWRWVAHPTDF